MRGADVAFLSAERAARQSNPAGFLDVAPELVVEVMSPDDTSAALEAKAAEYPMTGVVIVLVLDPRTRTAHAYRAGSAPEILPVTGRFEAPDILPGVSLPIASFFEG